MKDFLLMKAPTIR